jgi:serine/threonine-protein kinase 24/25/MST4
MHTVTGKEVAIKVVNLEADDEGIEEMRREISILSRCQSQYITKYHESVVCGTKLWIIMDFCGLGSLRNLVCPPCL